MSVATYSRAFTLVEVLVALAIFAVLAVIGYRTLSSMFQAREHLATQSTRLRDQALFFTRLESDIGAMLPRPIRNADGVTEPGLQVLSAAVSAVDPVIVFSRTGFAGAMGATGATGGNGAPQRVGYRLNEGKLELLVWDGLDAAPRARPNAYTALNDIREFKWRILDKSGNWRPEWPIRSESPSSQTTLPAALEVTITPVNAAPIVRLFALRELSRG